MNHQDFKEQTLNVELGDQINNKGNEIVKFQFSRFATEFEEQKGIGFLHQHIQKPTII